MQTLGLTVDGTNYRVLIEYDTMQRGFELTEGPNNGTAITGRAIRDIIGTSYTYSMTIHPDPSYPSEYDTLYQVLSSPVDYHSITLVYGQTTITFDAKILSGSDKYKGYYGGYQRWDEMTINFEPMEPQRIT